MTAREEGHLEGVVGWLSRKAGSISGYLILTMMFTIVADVLGRDLFNQPLVGGVEFNRTVLVVVVFFGMAVTQINGGHIRVDILLIRASPKLRWALETFALLLAFAVYAVTTFTTIPVTIRSIEIGEHDTGLIPFPIWPARLLMTVGLLLFATQVFVDLKSCIASRKTGTFQRERTKQEGMAPRSYD